MELLEPLAPLDGAAAAGAMAAGLALPFRGGPAAFALIRRPDGAVVPAATLRDAASCLTSPPRAWAGLPVGRPLIMGIVNVTPDSFSDGGDRLDPARAIAAGRAMAAQGADVIDVGGESTRPGSTATDPAIEQARILPVIRALTEAGLVVSVDTRHAVTMGAALDAGARIVNDISGFGFDPDAAGLVRRRGCPVVVMHMRGTPATMQSLAAYDDVALDVARELATRLEALDLAPGQAAVDPGIGFAKGPGHNEALLARLPVLLNLGCPILVGVSRKGFIGRIVGRATPKDRLAGSLAAALTALRGGASILRVHDVDETLQAVRVWEATCQAG